MNMAHYKDALLLFVSQWLGTTVPRLLAAFIGLLIVALFVQSLWDKRIRIVSAVIGMAFGIGLVAIAFDTHLLHWLVGLNNDERLRLTVLILSSVVLGTAFEAIRREHLQERYAILWIAAGMATLLGAVFPKTLAIIGVIFGADYTTSILAVLFIFVALVLFHFSLAFSRSDHRESKLAQRCALLEERLNRLENKDIEFRATAIPPPLPELTSTPPPTKSLIRRFSGAQIAAICVIVFSSLTVLVTGWMTPEPMIGDEITHFYMLKGQSANLGRPNFMAEIPVAFDKVPETRCYPHVCGWHYIGAIIYRISGESFRAIQAWHTLFWIQFLLVAYLFARHRGGDQSYASILFLMVLASLPVAVIFAIPFYQDIPVAAQVLTAFYLLSCRRRGWAMIFMLLAMGIKETAFLFIPVFILMWGWTAWKEEISTCGTRWRTWRAVLVSSLVAILIVCMYSIAWATVFKQYTNSEFYPLAPIQNAWHNFTHRSTLAPNTPSSSGHSIYVSQKTKPSQNVKPYEFKVISNHPGDLRLPSNFFIYGGVIAWLIAIVGLATKTTQLLRRQSATGLSTTWLWVIGFSYIIPAAYILRTSPDARFFLPAIPFLLLPLTEWAVRVPRIKWCLAVLSALVLLQVGAVHLKVYTMRKVSTGTREAITFLRDNPPNPRWVFMYPEGSFRLFPTPHNWYLDYHLREFWKGDNELRITMLHRYKIGAVVIKKNLISTVDENITDLGVYPTFFVKDIERDPRFKRIFDNTEYTIYSTP